MVNRFIATGDPYFGGLSLTERPARVAPSSSFILRFYDDQERTSSRCSAGRHGAISTDADAVEPLARRPREPLSGAELLERYRGVTGQVRAIYETVMDRLAQGAA